MKPISDLRRLVRCSLLILALWFGLAAKIANAATYTHTYYADGADHSMNVWLAVAGTHTFAVNSVPIGTYNYVGYRDSGSGYVQVYSDSTITGWDPSFDQYVANNYRIKLVVYDGNWNVKSVYYWYIYIDTTAPTTPGSPDLASADDTGSSSSDNITKNTSGLTFSWSASTDGGTGLAGYEYKLDSGSWTARSSTSVDISAGDGAHTFYVRAKDNAGNYSGSSSRSFTVDTVAPNVPSIVYPSVNQRITDTTPVFDWTGSDNAGGSGIWRYHLLVETDTLGQNRIDEYPTSSDYNTPAGQALDAGGAGYDWEVWAYDIAGNVSSGTGEKRFYIDDPPDTERPSSPGVPDLQASSDSGSSDTDNITADSTPTFTWSAATDNNAVTGYEYRVDSGSWVNLGNNLNVTLPTQSDGQRTLQVRAYDAAGNRSLNPSSLSFTVDTVAPNVPSIVYPSVNQRITDTTPAFDWTGSDNAGGSGIWRYHLLVETDTLGQNRIDEYPTSSDYNTPAGQALDAGGAGYDWEVWAYDIAGNVSSGTGEKRFYIDSPTIISAYWWMPLDVSDGDTVTMCAEVEGIPVGAHCTFQVYEDDGILWDDPVLPTLSGTVYTAEQGRTYVKATWTSQWQDDQSGDPEFYFKVTYGSASLGSSASRQDEVVVRKNRQQPCIQRGDFYYSPGESTESATLADSRIPVILVHGLNGDKMDDSKEYWHFWCERFNEPDMSSRFRVYRYVYDSRRPIANNGNDFASFVNQLYANNPAFAERQIVVIAHSMGGLVARYAMNSNSQFENHVHRLVTLATPHLGSPGANPTWLYWPNQTSWLQPGRALPQYLSGLAGVLVFFKGTEGEFDLGWHSVAEIPAIARSSVSLFTAHGLYNDTLVDASLTAPFFGTSIMQLTAADPKTTAYGGYFTSVIDGLSAYLPDSIGEEWAEFTDHYGLWLSRPVIAGLQKNDLTYVGDNDGIVPLPSALMGGSHPSAEKINLTQAYGESVDHSSYLDVASTMDYVAGRLLTMVKMTISPQSAIEAGARWRIAGGAWQKSSVSLNALKPGQYTIEFKDVSGWTTPANQLVTVNANQTTTATATYLVLPQTGSLQVNLSPAGAISAGAQWQVDGGAWQNSGATVSGLSVGDHPVAFKTVSGWTTPANQTVSVNANQTTTAIGTYVAIPQTGSLQVNLSPAGAISAGAQWQVDAGAWQNSGATVPGLSLGDHSVAFKTVSGWTTPANQTVSINANQTTIASGTYVAIPQAGSLQVNLSPAGAISAGAQWQVDAGAWQNSGATVPGLTLGDHSVAFKTMSGWTTPANQTVTINANQTTMATGIYIPEPQSMKQLTEMAMSNGVARFYLNGPVGSNYVVQLSSNFVSWVSFSTNTIPSSGNVMIVDPSATIVSRRFYRAIPFGQALVTPIGMEVIPAGSFQMGDSLDGYSEELPVHTVYVSAFFMDKFEVSRELWLNIYSWAITNGYQFDNVGSYKGTNHPIQSINWSDAVKWCNARSEKDRLTPCYYTDGSQTVVYRSGYIVLPNAAVKWEADGYRLPTEAEWERAARGNLSNKRFPWGDVITHSNANYYSDARFAYDVSPTRGSHPEFAVGDLPFTNPGGALPANAFGLHDLAGNVVEWCWDGYDVNWYSNPQASSANPHGPEVYSQRVFRGGTCGSEATQLRCATRAGNAQTIADVYIGFRCVKMAPN